MRARSRMMVRNLSLWCALLLFSPPAAGPVLACSCGPNPPCAAAWRADAVFIGRIVETTRERISRSLGWTVHRVAVARTLRGAVEPSVVIVPHSPPSAARIAESETLAEEVTLSTSCDYPFELGHEYVIYARRAPDGRWMTSMCTGTKPLEAAAADLEYFATLVPAPSTGRVLGTVERTVPDPHDRARPRTIPAAGVTVALSNGADRLTVTSDSEGRIDAHVAPGDYTVTPVVPATLRVYGAPARVSVPAGGCAPVYFGLASNGRIQGRVVLQDGTPAPRVVVEMIPAGAADDERLDLSASPLRATDDRGRFSIDGILPGSYYLAMNGRRGPALSSPHATTWFPGVADKRAARVIELREGERRTGFTLVVTPLAEATVSGLVLSAEHQPQPGARVSATPVDHRKTVTSTARTDSNGAFELPVLAGVKYLIRAEAHTSSGVRQAETTVTGGAIADDVRLVLRP